MIEPRHGLLKSIQLVLSSRSGPLLLALLAGALVLPSLGGGLQADDFFLKISLQGSRHIPELACAPWDAFAFANGDPERTSLALDIGLVPWWTVRELKLAFFRPLASLSHWLDFTLWPDAAGVMHQQNILWYGAVILAAAVLFRQVMGPTWVAGLAGLLFAIDEAHATAAGWISGRNGLMAVFFGIWALWFYIRRRRRRLGAGPWTPLFLALSLLSAEAGVAAVAFLVSYALCLDRGSPGHRAAALAPSLCVLVVWAVGRSALGYGTYGSVAYVDPVSEPVSFAKVAVDCGPLLLLAQWALIPLDLYPVYDIFIPGLKTAVWIAAVAAVVVLAVMLGPLLLRHAAARFWALAMALSVLPLCATSFPMDRILFFVGLGASPLLAWLLCAVMSQNRTKPALYRGIGARILAWLLIAVHIPISMALLPLRAAMPFGPQSLSDRVYLTTALGPEVVSQTVVVVNAPAAAAVGATPLLRELSGDAVPKRMRVLGPSLSSLELSRTDHASVVVRPQDGYFTLASDLLFRAPRFPLTAGARVTLDGMDAQILSVADNGWPAEVKFTFDVPLDHPSLRWLQWRDGAFIPFEVPAVGAAVRLPKPDPFKTPPAITAAEPDPR